MLSPSADQARARLLRRGFALEYATLAWNVAGIIVLAFAAVAARSVALAGFGLDSLIEIGASTVVTLPSVRRTGLPSARPVLALPAARPNMTAAVTAVQAMPGTEWRGW